MFALFTYISSTIFRSSVSSSGIQHDETLRQVEDDLKLKWEEEQNALKKKLIAEDVEDWQVKREGLKLVGGVDISFVKGDNVNACASLVVLDFESLEVVYKDIHLIKLTAPYIPGFLAFREVEFLIAAISRLRTTQPKFLPQVILVDGNGILHPREFGLASHLGVLCDIPTVGVAKKLFQVDGLEKDSTHLEKIRNLEKGGDTFPLTGNSGRLLGLALRSCDSSSNPIYVSVGHNISLDTALWVVRRCCKFRIPEPVRQADIQSREFLRDNLSLKDE